MLEEKLAVLRHPLEAFQKVLHGLEQATTPARPRRRAAGHRPAGQRLLGEVFSGTTLTLSRIFTTIVVLFFLLSSGDRLLRGLVEMMPRFQEKRQVVEIAAEIEENVSTYLLTITLMNALVGAATGVAMWLCGLANPLLWGAAAFLLELHPDPRAAGRRRHVPRRRPGQPRLAVAGPAAGCALSRSSTSPRARRSRPCCSPTASP